MNGHHPLDLDHDGRVSKLEVAAAVVCSGVLLFALNWLLSC